MYVKKLLYENIGPIINLCVDLPFTPTGNPKPVFFVGENGSGKSLLLSNIVDSFYEIAQTGYFNGTIQNESNGYKYYKTINRNQIRNGEDYLIAYIQYSDGTDKIEYMFKSGNKAYEEFIQNSNLEINSSIRWKGEENYKGITANKEQVQEFFHNNVLCFFGPSRYEKPSWMGREYFELTQSEHITIRERFTDKLENPISVSDVTSVNLQWMLDIIVDSRADIERKEDGSLHIVNVDVSDLLILSNARLNIETIMSEILGEPVYFSLNWRNAADSRFNIKSRTTNNIVVPSLNSLSTGQIALFNMFSTIIRYADNNNINNSINIANISGIVVIDEAELHLHSTLQREVLPKLIKKFPKIQFILTTHSPLFLLGMDELYGGEGYEIYQMPTCTKIDVERFSEFQKAYEYLTLTQKYNNEITLAINSLQNKPLVVTEGATDWKHMLAAYNKLKEQSEYKACFENMEFDFLQYEPKNSEKNIQYKLEMGWSPLVEMCRSFAKIHQDRKIIFIADRDNKEVLKILQGGEELFKNWGNNVFSFVLPIPHHREQTPEICIEHLYTDEEIKTELVDDKGIHRRLYMGYEFDNNGVASELNRFCCNRNICGENKINIIEGSEKERVIGLTSNKDINFALPKMNFAEKVLAGISPFADFDFSNFIPIFRIIKEIITC